MVNDSYIRFDLAGYPFNGKYPPKEHNKGNLYHGYDNPAQECLFYDFAVMGYDLMVKYQGETYYFMVDEDCVWLSDEQFAAQIQRFSNPNEVLETFVISGKPLIFLVDDLEEFDIF